MILFLYGEENYLSRQKLASIKVKYIDASLGSTNLVSLDGATLEYKNFCRHVLAMPFLAKTRLVIIENLLGEKKKRLQEQIAQFLPQVPKNMVLVFYENNLPDKRTKLFKILIKTAKSQEFKKLASEQLRTWIAKKLSNKIDFNKIKFTKNQLITLLEQSGNNLWQLINEIEKISLFLADNHQTTPEELKILTCGKLEDNVFNFLTALAQKNTAVALKKLHELLDGGTNELYVFTMIIYQFRTMIIIKDLLEQNKNLLQIAALAKINPYVVRKTSQVVNNYSQDQLKKNYLLMLDTDMKIKTGKISPVLALDILIVKICQ